MTTADLTVVIDADDSKFRKKLADNLKRGKAFNAAFKQARGAADPFETAMKSHSEAYRKMEASQKRLETFERRRKISQIEMADAIKRKDTAEQSRAKRAMGQYDGLIKRTKTRIGQLKTETDLYGKILAQRKTMTAAKQDQSLFGVPYNAIKSPVTGKTIVDPTKEQIKITQAYQDQAAALENAKKSAGRLEAENHQLRSGQDKLKTSVDKTSDAINKGRKNTDFWNSSFTKFSVIMSGIAATLFVFQQVGAWITGAINKLTQFEKAAMSLENSLGSNYLGKSMASFIQSNTTHKVADAGSAATELMKAGYSSTQIQKNLVKALDYSATGFVSVSEAMEIATTDTYGLADAMEYYSQKTKSSSEAFWGAIGNEFDKFVRVYGELVAKSGAFGEFFKFLVSIPTAFTNVGDKLLRLQEAKNPEASPTFYPPEMLKGMYDVLYQETGSLFSKDFQAKTNDLAKTIDLFTKMMATTSHTVEDAKNLQRWAIEKDYELKWQEIFAKEVKSTNNQIKTYEQIFKDTGFYHPTLELYQDLKSQNEAGKALALSEAIYGKGTSSMADISSDLAGISQKRLTDNFKRFENRNKRQSERGQNYFDDTGIMTDEYKQYRLNKNDWLDQLRRASGDPAADRKQKADEIQFFKDANQRMFEDQQYLFERTKKVSEEYYTKQSQLITDERDHWIEAGYDKVAMQQMYIDRMQDLNDQYYRTFTQGAKSALEEYRKNFIDEFDMMKNIVSTAFNSMENVGSNFLFDSIKGDAHSWREYMIDIFDSVAKAWADMVAKMVIQQMFASDSGGNGWLSFVGSLLGSANSSSSGTSSMPIYNFQGGRASGGPVYPNSSYWVGERGPEILHMGSAGGNITPNNQIGGNINVTINNAPAGTTVNETQTGNIRDIVIDIVGNETQRSRGFRSLLKAAVR